MPLRNLDDYSDGPALGGANTGGSVNSTGAMGGGGVGGTAPSVSELVCGNGIVEGVEECDDGGVSDACTVSCQKRKCIAGCSCDFVQGRSIATCATPGNYADSKTFCEKSGWRLALPTSQLENDRMRFAASKRGLQQMWLGASDQANEGDWLDASGELLWKGGAAGDVVAGRFEAWGVGQPDNAAMIQDCAVLLMNAEWDDGACAAQLPFFCEEASQTVAKTCGDGNVDPNEACDPSALATAECDLDCTVARCGDGVVNAAAGELCDDGNQDPFDACDACQPTGLGAHYPLTETIGSLASDISGNGHHGALTGGAVYSSAGRGLELDGATGYVLVPATRAPQFSGPITLMALAQVEAPLPASGIQDLISQNLVDQETWLRLEGPRLQAGTWVNATGLELASADVAAMIPLVVFHHFAARYDGKRWSIFVDGVPISSMNASRGPLTLDADLLLGGRPSGGRFTNGILRDVRIYKRNLSSTEILDLAQTSLRAVKNLALAGTASQSSTNTMWAGDASKAIDGNVDGSLVGGMSVTHTADAELAPWWQVQLAASACVSEVELFNRTDCCSTRLTNGVIETSTDGVVFEPAATFPTDVSIHQRFSFPKRQARYVKVSLNNTGVARVLSLAEAQVFGTPGSCPP